MAPEVTPETPEVTPEVTPETPEVAPEAPKEEAPKADEKPLLLRKMKKHLLLLNQLLQKLKKQWQLQKLRKKLKTNFHQLVIPITHSLQHQLWLSLQAQA